MKVPVVVLVLLCWSCGSTPSVQGKWYSYSDNGDYQELWLSENRALSYLTVIDKMLLYEYSQVGDSLKFNLIESDVYDSHEFILRIKDMEENLLISEFISGDRIDTLKTYFRISAEPILIPDQLQNCLLFRNEIVARESAGGQSHEGHNH